MVLALSESEKSKFTAAKLAAAYIKSGMTVGLGTGSTAEWLVRHLGTMVVEEGLDIVAVPTSFRTAELAISLGIKTITLEEAIWLDLTIDGTDEFDKNFNLIKGGGGALLREKIVATASRKVIVIADKSKDVTKLGNFALPIEIIPFGSRSTQILIEAKLKNLGYKAFDIKLRQKEGVSFVTDEGNYILDTHLGEISNPKKLTEDLNNIPGVVENGLFVDICETVIVGSGNGVGEVLTLSDGKVVAEKAQHAQDLYYVGGK